MRIVVRYGGVVSELVGRFAEELNVPENTTVENLVAILAGKYEMLKLWLDKIPLLLIHVNGINVTGHFNMKLNENDVVEISTPLYEGG